MPDSYAHKYNAQSALNIANYRPRNHGAFILGCNGPDVFYYYRKYDPFRKQNMSSLSKLMHNSRTGLFLQNMFCFAQTNTQKDFCLGWLCHYSMDSVVHPYINYVTTAYGHPFNIEQGHSFFESSLDSYISKHEQGFAAADPHEQVLCVVGHADHLVRHDLPDGQDQIVARVHDAAVDLAGDRIRPEPLRDPA